jgi:hypothetical protein
MTQIGRYTNWELARLLFRGRFPSADASQCGKAMTMSDTSALASGLLNNFDNFIRWKIASSLVHTRGVLGCIRAWQRVVRCFQWFFYRFFNPRVYIRKLNVLAGEPPSTESPLAHIEEMLTIALYFISFLVRPLCLLVHLYLNVRTVWLIPQVSFAQAFPIYQRRTSKFVGARSREYQDTKGNSASCESSCQFETTTVEFWAHSMSDWWWRDSS